MHLTMKQVVTIIRDFPGKAFLVGGACRDTALGLGEPKDYDIAVFPDVAEALLDVLEDNGFIRGYDCANYDRDDLEYGAEGIAVSDIRECWSRIVKFHGATYDIDVLVTPHEDCETIQDVLDKFDFSINQFYVDARDVFVNIVPIKFGGRIFGICEQVRPVDYLRAQHIIGKAKAANWSVQLLAQPYVLE